MVETVIVAKNSVHETTNKKYVIHHGTVTLAKRTREATTRDEKLTSFALYTTYGAHDTDGALPSTLVTAGVDGTELDTFTNPSGEEVPKSKELVDLPKKTTEITEPQTPYTDGEKGTEARHRTRKYRGNTAEKAKDKGAFANVRRIPYRADHTKHKLGNT